MQTTTPQLLPELRAPLERYQEVRASFETARDEADRLDAELQRQRKAAESAENEAQQAREEVAQLLREPGTSAKAIQQLKAKERAAYTLAEDYRSVSAELEAAYKEAAAKAGIAKEEERSCHTALLSSYAEVLMAQATNVLEPLYRAIRMQERAYASQTGRGLADWEYRNDDARSAALAVMYGHIKRGLDTFTIDMDGDVVLRAVQRPAGLDRFQELSPAAQHRNLVLQQLAAQQQ
ncbi:hypothetical protein [Ralstonia sp. ASV6]|uniref:hypothetical protein n=1 Tax=Ralstonia sp. ASV6 TaxID=2795124 RepID=UPI0018EA829D|nr:hypothetical protein [Ralstonia sp. ASV6]